MKSKTVGFSESQEYINEIGLKRWRKIWHEVEVEAGDDPDACYKFAEEKVIKWQNNGSGDVMVNVMYNTSAQPFNIHIPLPPIKDLQSLTNDSTTTTSSTSKILSVETLLDCLVVLYDECMNSSLRREKTVSEFIELCKFCK